MIAIQWEDVIGVPADMQTLPDRTGHSVDRGGHNHDRMYESEKEEQENG